MRTRPRYLGDRVACVLERLVSRNSGNSSMPPSGDDAPGRKPPRKQRRAAEREDGEEAQAGQAARRAGSGDELGRARRHPRPLPGRDVRVRRGPGRRGDLGVARSFQQLEIPEPSAQRIQHDLHRECAAAAAQHVAARPPGVPDAPVSIGPNLRALAVYLLVFQHVPVERCRELIADAAGARVSAGFIHSCLRKAAELAADVIKLIGTLITAAHVAGFDETTLRAGPAGQKKYVLGAFTEQHSLFFLGARDLGIFRDFGILPDFAGVVVSDRYVNYSTPAGSTSPGTRPAWPTSCATTRTPPRPTRTRIWPAQAQRALRGLIGAWNAARDNGLAAIPADTADPLITEFRRAVPAGLSTVPRIPGPKHSTAQHPGRDLLEFCRDREDDVLRFTTDTRIWPTNNISERGVRPTKTQQKISGRLTSEDATQDRLDIRSYIDSPQLHGRTGLVMQRFHRVPGDPSGSCWHLNSEPARPDLAIILEADPDTIAERLAARGPHNRFQLTPGSSHAEAHFYRQATERLIQAGFDVLRVDCNKRPPEQSAAFIRDQLVSFFASAVS